MHYLVIQIANGTSLQLTIYGICIKKTYSLRKILSVWKKWLALLVTTISNVFFTATTYILKDLFIRSAKVTKVSIQNTKVSVA